MISSGEAAPHESGEGDLRVIKVEAKAGYVLKLSFEDGFTGTADLRDLAGRGVFACWNEPGAFESVSVGDGGEVVWECGVDLCGDALYLRATGKDPAEVLPGLGREPRCA